jgi:hypothetical protein
VFQDAAPVDLQLVCTTGFRELRKWILRKERSSLQRKLAFLTGSARRLLLIGGQSPHQGAGERSTLLLNRTPVIPKGGSEIEGLTP